MRSGEGGIRAWAAETGEYYSAFDGSYGGLWRRNGRPPQQIAGIGFSAQGTFSGSYYRRTPASYADDVKCSHGSTSGSLDEDSLHYLMTRGLNREETIRLLIKGFLNDVIEFIKSDSIKNFIQSKLESTINGH